MNNDHIVNLLIDYVSIMAKGHFNIHSCATPITGMFLLF